MGLPGATLPDAFPPTCPWPNMYLLYFQLINLYLVCKRPCILYLTGPTALNGVIEISARDAHPAESSSDPLE
jgi:hypothetical protein